MAKEVGSTICMRLSPASEICLFTLAFFISPDEELPIQINNTRVNVICHKFQNLNVVASAYFCK